MGHGVWQARQKARDIRCCGPIAVDGILRVHRSYWSAHMKVSLRTYGGLMGGLGQQAHMVDDATLDDEDKRELHKLVAAAAAEPRAGATDQVRDAQTYEIEIDDN